MECAVAASTAKVELMEEDEEEEEDEEDVEKGSSTEDLAPKTTPVS